MGTQSSSLYNSTTKLGQGSSSGTFSDTVTGLSSGTTYYYRAVAQNSAGTVYGGVQSFVTSGGGNQQPFVSTNSATSVSANNATLNCYVNPYSSSNTTRWFEWGTTQSMTNRTNTVNHGSSASNASEYISGLSNNTTYYFRCAAQNQYSTSYGSMLSFYTGTGGGVQATAITNLATNIGETSARLNGLGLNLSNIATDGWFEWGHRSRSAILEVASRSAQFLPTHFTNRFSDFRQTRHTISAPLWKTVTARHTVIF